MLHIRLPGGSVMKFPGIGTFGVELRRNLYPKVCNPNSWFWSLMTWLCRLEKIARDCLLFIFALAYFPRLLKCHHDGTWQSAELNPISITCSSKVLWNFQQILIWEKLHNTTRWGCLFMKTQKKGRNIGPFLSVVSVHHNEIR